jgi:hypothetical protein
MEVRKPRGLWFKGASVLAAVGTVTAISLTSVGVASASAPNQSVNGIKVSATIGGSDSDATPTIECSWALTDDNLAGGGETQQYSYAIGSDIGPSSSGLSYTNLVQPSQSLGAPASGSPSAPSYGGAPNAGQSFTYGNDDNPSSYLTSPNCTSTGAATSQPTQLSGSQASPISTGIQVLPNAFDSPAPRRLEVWAAVDNATAVNFNVFYPNGAEDTDLGGVQIGGSTTACNSYGTSGSLLTNMFGAAGPAGASSDASNQISGAAISNATGTGIVNLCNDNEKSLWYQAFTLSKDDPNGTYTVEVQAVNNAGTSDSWISFYVIPFFDLAVDFNSVTFTSSQTTPPSYFVSGDTTWAPPNSTFPTVTNGGNSGEEIGVDFSVLTYVPPVGSDYYISSFDANLGYNSGTVLSTDVPATAGTTTFISNNGSSPATGAQLVCPNDTPKLDLSLAPPAGDPAGTYTGSLSVVGESDIQGAGGCTTDNGAPYVLPGPPAAFKTLTDLDPGTAPVRAS